MKEDDLTALFPRVWHMAEDGSWDSIRRHGLLSTTALLDLYGVEGDRRLALEAQRRPESVPISGDGLPNAVIRDQKPMTKSALAKCLTGGMTPEEWFRLLNQRVFFWLSRDRLRGLLSARAYRGRPQTVLTLDTVSLVATHRSRIELSPINSGATIYNPRPRGRNNFLPIADYPFDERRKTRPRATSVVELVVLHGLPDILDHLVAAHRINGDHYEELWRRAGTDPADVP